MQDELVHEEEPGFEEFIETELKGLAQRAEEAGICMDCLSDRLLVELVAGIVRSGANAADVLGMVAEGLDEAEDDAVEKSRRSHRMH